MDKSPFEVYYGPVDTPEKHVRYCIYQSRATGRTEKLIMSLPESKCAIIVHKLAFGRDIERRIKELRPNYDTRCVKFVAVSTMNSPSFRSLDCPVFVDNAVLDEMQINFVNNVNEYYHLRNKEVGKVAMQNELVKTLQMIMDLTKNFTPGSNDGLIHDLCSNALGKGTPALDRFKEMLDTIESTRK